MKMTKLTAPRLQMLLLFDPELRGLFEAARDVVKDSPSVALLGLRSALRMAGFSVTEGTLREVLAEVGARGASK